MARFYGEVGYADTVENPANSGIWTDIITEYSYFGDVVRNTKKFDSSDKINNDISIMNTISIIADEYAFQHFFTIRYVRWAGVLWTVTDVEVESPRLILRLGSVYNGPTPTTP
jgi:hypothetical protein